MARAGRLARKTGLSWGPILIYLAVVVVATGGLVAWDVAYRRREEAARRPPPPEVLARNLIENIIGRGSVKSLTVDEARGTVDVTFESATYPPAARALVSGEVVARNLDQLLVGLRVTRGEPLVYVRTADGQVVQGARAEYTGRVVAVLVKAGDRVQEGRAMVLIEPDDKTDARKNLETEGLLASQAVLSQLPAIKTVTSRITYKDITLATVVGTRGEREVTTTYHPSLR